MSESVSLNANETIYEAIRQIAFHRIVNGNSVVRNTEKKLGYVVKVHTDPEDELLGTVDVQEYLADESQRLAVQDGTPIGLHQGVYLSALMNNPNGMFVIPFLYSDVVITIDPETLKEYVIQYSHADTIQFDAHQKVVVGVTETEALEETEDGPDFDELEKTGKHAHTVYTPQSALIEVAKGSKNEEKSTITVTADHILSQHDQSQLQIDGKQLLAKYNAKEIVIKDDGVYVGSGSATEPAVLGNQLASILVEWLGALSSMMTPTLMGPQPPANVAQFVSLQAKISSYQSALSGFLSNTVKVQ